jgi:hypothetical protein
MTTSLEAIRTAGGDVSNVLDVWEAPLGNMVQVFVSAGSANELRRGEPYETWVVSLGPDGSPISQARFASTACQTRGSR